MHVIMHLSKSIKHTITLSKPGTLGDYDVSGLGHTLTENVPE